MFERREKMVAGQAKHSNKLWDESYARLLRWRDETEAGGEAARMIGLIEGELKYVRF